MKIIIQSIKNYFKSKKDRGLEPVFFEKIGDQKTSRDQMRENLIKALKKNGWTIKKFDSIKIIKFTLKIKKLILTRIFGPILISNK